MPSHHHWVFLPDPTWAEQFSAQQQDKEKKRTLREGISHSIQSFTGTQCNRARGGEGAFWQAETFDHYARDQEELLRIIHYIEQNPVVAGLVDRAEDFQWSSAPACDSHLRCLSYSQARSLCHFGPPNLRRPRRAGGFRRSRWVCCRPFVEGVISQALR